MARKIDLPPKLESLTDNAKAVGGAWFGMMMPGRDGSLTFEMVVHRPTERAQVALDELVNAGLVSRAGTAGGGIQYRPVEDLRSLSRWLMANRNREDLRFELVEMISPEARV